MRKFKEWFLYVFFLANGLLAVVALAAIVGLLVRNSLPAFKLIGLKPFLLSVGWNPTGYQGSTYGLIPMVVSTLMVTIGSIAWAVPLGVATAAYLAEMARPWEREILKPAIEVLAGVPSVVLGFFGVVVLAPVLTKVFHTAGGLNALNGSILLGIMSLPTIIALSEEAMAAVPAGFKQASLALGATRWQTFVRVTLPSAIPGVSSAVMLGIGRSIGETMAVLMVTGNAVAIPSSFLDSVRTMTATVAIEMGEVAYGSSHYYALFLVGLILFLLTFGLNLTAELVIRRGLEVTGIGPTKDRRIIPGFAKAGRAGGPGYPWDRRRQRGVEWDPGD